ncbi:hypothetical protein PP7435_CHR3-2238 [Komagataella phaffii CBS 7435]|uniref:Stress-associated endoplasmic reticulum protein n=2 Tax=Komagataella phaffii TaxID=460519 RepID=C4R4G4_KOMPG|nr:Hypothetical protein PAS_chr3_0401 [Komagataella phaffii GS115]CAH2449795.1 hypothetical protein BQ9382_C3-4258 [Komagataella phaffii CBS 7435]CAY70450.1 Hypothetical protein PAS_chr3_0401 [Komagataella phaffii GS115]SCV12252.1 hypothetical protein PP7435_CHR3-2238 [Komagataella phaffii CBS 7435]
MAPQTPRQRIANEKFVKRAEAQQGKVKKARSKREFPVSTKWVIILLFLLIGGGVLEILRLFF